VPDPIAGGSLSGDKDSVTDVKRWTVLLHVDKDRDALWLVQALENSDAMRLAWLARDAAEASLYLDGQDVYANRARFPEPNVVIVNSTARDALTVLQAAYRLPNPPVIVQLTTRPDVSESLSFLEAGADCSQPKPASLSETIAFVDWLEDWLTSIAGPVDEDNDRILAFPGIFPRRDLVAPNVMPMRANLLEHTG
jgi:hypothetical protein